MSTGVITPETGPVITGTWNGGSTTRHTRIQVASSTAGTGGAGLTGSGNGTIVFTLTTLAGADTVSNVNVALKQIADTSLSADGISSTVEIVGSGIAAHTIQTLAAGDDVDATVVYSHDFAGTWAQADLDGFTFKLSNTGNTDGAGLTTTFALVVTVTYTTASGAVRRRKWPIIILRNRRRRR